MADDEWDDTIDIDEKTELSDDERAGDASEDDGSDWRFSLDDLDDGDEEAAGFSLYGDVEAGSPSMENALFVAIGLALGLVVAVQLFF